jgi:hypothetical protein
MSAKYWLVSQSVIGFDDIDAEVSGLVTEEDVTGRWQMYQAWLAEGNTPEEWQPETIQPASEPVIEETPADSTEEPVTEDGN